MGDRDLGPRPLPRRAGPAPEAPGRPGGEARRLKRTLLRVALLAVSVAAALLVAELGPRLQLRVAAGASLDTQARRSRPSRWPDVVYELRPGLRGLFHGKPLSTNSHGMRGPEVPLAKPPGVFRIAGLGDSQMFGWGVGDEEVYLRRLEVLLNQRTFEHKALAFAPDLVVVHFVRHDLAAPHFAAPPRSYLLAVVRAALTGAGEGEGEEPAARRARRGSHRRRFAHLGGAEAYTRAMARLADLSGRRGIPVLVMTLERSGHPVVREAVRRHGFRFVQAAPRFYAYLGARGLARTPGAWAQTFRLERDWHPNALAHRLFAEMLVEELAALGVIGYLPAEELQPEGKLAFRPSTIFVTVISNLFQGGQSDGRGEETSEGQVRRTINC